MGEVLQDHDSKDVANVNKDMEIEDEQSGRDLERAYTTKYPTQDFATGCHCKDPMSTGNVADTLNEALEV